MLIGISGLPDRAPGWYFRPEKGKNGIFHE